MASYLVLARKYRPQAFADLTGQEHVVQTLSNAMKTERVAHALLFCGPRGCGKTTTARIVAKALNCEQGPTPTPCGVCLPCREITAGTDVDVQEIDAASNTGVDNVRELRESAKYLPARDRYKIFIVDEVHMLSKAAFNAFLKTLEEPPGHVKFLFATTDPQALPDTILSRCQRHNFRLVPLRLIVERLRNIATAEKVAVEDGALALVARQAAGSMRDALSILDQLFSSCGGDQTITEADAARALGALDRGVVAELAGALLARDAKTVLEGVARVYDGGHDLKRLGEDLATHLRNLLAVSVAGSALDLPDHELKALRDQANRAEGAELARLFELVHAAITEMSRAAQPRHAFEIALLRAVYLAPSDSVQGLLKRTDDILRRLGGEPPPAPSGGGGGGRSGGPPSGSGGGRWTPGGGSATHASAVAAPVAVAPAPIHAVAAAARIEEPAPRPAPMPVPAPVPAPPPAPPIAVAPPAPVVAPPAPGPVAAAAAPAAKPGRPWERHLSVVPGGASETPAAEAPSVRPEPVVAAPPAPMVAATPVPPPPPTPPPGPPVVVDSALVARWPSLVEGVRERRRPLASFLEHARPLGLTETELTLGFTRGSNYAQRINEDQKTVEGLLAEVLGHPIRLKLAEVNEREAHAVPTLAESRERAERAAQAGRLQEGREHTSVLLALKVLGAEIEDVKDLGGDA